MTFIAPTTHLTHLVGQVKANNTLNYLFLFKRKRKKKNQLFIRCDVYGGLVDQNNQRNGHGTSTKANGDKYEGEWQDNKMNGHGTLHPMLTAFFIDLLIEFLGECQGFPIKFG